MELDINELLNFSPLMKTFTFNAWVVAGFTPITRGSKLDYYINRETAPFCVAKTICCSSRPAFPTITDGTNTANTGIIYGSTSSPGPTG